MLIIDKDKTTMEGTISDILNELAALTVRVKKQCSEVGISEEQFDEAFALTLSAQKMAEAGMTIDEVEEVLGYPVDREKSYDGR